MKGISVLVLALSLFVVYGVNGQVQLRTHRNGDGRNFPKPGQKAVVHYTGTLNSNGQKFDSSRDRGTPFTFPVGMGRVIKCWDQGIQQLSLGQRATLYCPAELAYGQRGIPGTIPANAALNFDVELLDIQ